jgi:HAD superfamily hydrolase (TIGR01509 family)
LHAEENRCDLKRLRIDENSFMPLIIFDCDGVLVDSETLENEISAQCLTQAGFPITGRQARTRFIGLSSKAVIAQVEAELGRKLPPNWEDEYHARSHEALASQVEAIEGVVAVIDALEAMGFQTAVASSGEHAKMKITLGRTGLYERFKGRIFSAQDVAQGKPAPDVYLLAASTLGFAPETCFAVEDSPNGARAAIAAGMTTFGYAAQIDPDLLRAVGVIHVFFDMQELPALLIANHSPQRAA